MYAFFLTALPPAASWTVTAYGPLGARRGTVPVRDVVVELILVSATPPIAAVIPLAAKPVPVMVTVLPPWDGPAAGETDVITGTVPMV